VALIVEIEAFLNETRRHIVEPSGSNTVVIRVPRHIIAQDVVTDLDADDDDLITWEDAAWQ
jgi:tRNA A37 threonylcarbamoyladenosine synthetase subunit TsaC/SUA5/YrdC